MKYCSVMGADIRIWHPTMTVGQIEKLIGLKACKSHNVGEDRTRGDFSLYKDTYCCFEIIIKKKIAPEDVIIECKRSLDSCHRSISSSGGRIWIYLKICDLEFIQLTFDSKTLSNLIEINAELTIENHCLNADRQ